MSMNRPEEEWDLPESDADREKRLHPPTKKRKVWEVQHLRYPSSTTHECDDAEYRAALADSWEPFAVMGQSAFDATVWLRRMS
jgi:hypothetical protein